MLTDNLAGIVNLEDATNSAMVAVVMPYLPKMQRCGIGTFNTIVDALGNQDWSRIDQTLRDYMTESERKELCSPAHMQAREELKRAYATRRSYKDDLFKLVLGIAAAGIEGYPVTLG